MDRLAVNSCLEDEKWGDDRGEFETSPGVPSLNDVWVQRVFNFDRQNKTNLNRQLFLSVLDGVRFLELREKKKLYLISKRIFDLVFSLFLLILLSPLFFLIAITIKMFSKGPVFFLQRRIGQDFKIFWIYKFRTMKEGASEKFSEDWGPLQKLSSDVRVTRIGSLLRKWKLDELPQLFNVLKGDMSLIGPRPFSIEDSLCCPKIYVDRFAVLPGMTGFWQAYFCNTIHYSEKFKYDWMYSKECSWLLDLRICIKTPVRVFLGEFRN